ncbi:translation elongation factor Ts [Candidatus Shapirobacteria bacterium CG08_land_8_20_14_0_20_39_18]|uniref:Elongation factor Ts n=1 Tax=Candidatus Shapirobacteria bacterium CG08_land_8_20_14_0_20_39_18 TaxID=1974883 RepID=A0A2M6XDE4_9BACT|nr:MAG: translation elongation factor Ts [Candidatus Shapirobacteria bacterium CG08_land_8_20_14_0_20_39_18]PIY66043.1 MAG: translation elongation factor Ts [Candidatus Shapirobacteria bacterium CG_4_10_14_0_8_um_filter_39_15]PJE68727.1 MAG: translation elongation factor Ts [Candidatus Shapirobacteria bacterium CG10_big_fil_rev_8_21_14_0_10_38_8]
MITVSVDLIKKLREETNAPVMECKSALQEANGDIEKAKEILKKKGMERADKKASRETKAGLVESYTHNNGRVGVMVEVFCETDFVARNEEFKKLCHELALQIASMNPESVADLFAQPWIRDESKTIEQLVKETIGKLGENIKVNRFVRFELGVD